MILDKIKTWDELENRLSLIDKGIDNQIYTLSKNDVDEVLEKCYDDEERAEILTHFNSTSNFYKAVKENMNIDYREEITTAISEALRKASCKMNRGM